MSFGTCARSSFPRLTNVVAVDGCPGSLEAETDILIPSAGPAADLLGASGLGVQEKRLLLESTLGLDTKLNVRHVGRVCGRQGRMFISNRR